ncbi:hypothetical protein GUITHDRAFT_150889 [Guillardia theta CCMP2712]|uniref:Alpha-ketoglutarate-dependent dioxygenase AlkB-like domain-containing protein n=3 Tax=Guillardia theta TaxID=55529 RepID=L1JT83_GUITC|nr:hypothetical protein GUITHDRAFT_150889 [Guillardia theta CCMP2712]EKX51400.1 hypothetical protein GUITHDRAFT_150889 [Guillardia theta CCMP2712]|mmetsp:Transcript_47154/g.147566  ORF Transcript_47154/g.147566 Transcript_47154/m.147566 type:complete len:194 (+) Transcript_47154:376-957(+)|eukprot:XP_005838380.1 hypothetical protein GUITHDRAFT_150889 [Guillardia theta CCMP2712]
MKPKAIRDVPGLFQFPDFITEDEEGLLLQSLDTGNKWQLSSFNGECMTQRWGVVTDLKRRSVRPCSIERGEEDLPSFLRAIIEKWINRCEVIAQFHPNEANANSYEKHKGHSLAAHFDDRFLSGDILVNLSLGADCHMTFARKDKIKVLVPRRSLQVVTGRARFEHTHGIDLDDFHGPRRVSITFRRAKLTCT